MKHLQQISNTQSHALCSYTNTYNNINNKTSIKELVKIANQIDTLNNIDIHTYDDVLFHDDLLVNLNKRLLKLLKFYRRLLKYEYKYEYKHEYSNCRNRKRLDNNNTATTKATAVTKKDNKQHKQQQLKKMTMVKICILCSSLHKIYSSCTWSTLHLIFQEPSLSSKKYTKNEICQHKMNTSRLNALNNALLLVVDTIILSSNINNNNNNINVNRKGINNTTMVSLTKVLSSMSRISSIAATQMNAKTASYMIQLLKMKRTTENNGRNAFVDVDFIVPFRTCHSYAVTILANLINYECFDMTLIDELFNVLLQHLRDDENYSSNNNNNNNNDDDDEQQREEQNKLFRQETWRLILHLSNFEHTHHYILRRKDVMEVIQKTLHDVDVHERMIGITILKKLGIHQLLMNHHNHRLPMNYIHDQLKWNSSNIIEELCSRVFVDRDHRVIDASLLALCEMIRYHHHNHHHNHHHHQKQLIHQEKHRLVPIFSFILLHKTINVGRLCLLEIQKVFYIIARNIDASCEESWSVLETLIVLSNNNDHNKNNHNYNNNNVNMNMEAQEELIHLSKRVCKYHPLQLFENIASALNNGSVRMKFLCSTVLKEMSNDSNIAKIMSKDERISKALVQVVSTTSNNGVQHEIMYMNCIHTIISISLSTTEIDHLLMYKDVLPILIQFLSKKSRVDKKLKAEAKDSIMQLSNAMLLETTCV